MFVECTVFDASVVERAFQAFAMYGEAPATDAFLNSPSSSSNAEPGSKCGHLSRVVTLLVSDADAVDAIDFDMLRRLAAVGVLLALFENLIRNFELLLLFANKLLFDDLLLYELIEEVERPRGRLNGFDEIELRLGRPRLHADCRRGSVVDLLLRHV